MDLILVIDNLHLTSKLLAWDRYRLIEKKRKENLYIFVDSRSRHRNIPNFHVTNNISVGGRLN